MFFRRNPDQQSPEVPERRQLEAIFRAGRPSLQTPPQAPGIYRWVHLPTGKIVYVGKAVNLLRRRNEHLCDPHSPFNLQEFAFAWKAAQGDLARYIEQIDGIERKHIDRHQPPNNVRDGGGGRIPRIPVVPQPPSTQKSLLHMLFSMFGG